MKTQVVFGVVWLASAQVIIQDEDASRATVLLQRAVVHPGLATVDISADGRFVAFESAAALPDLNLVADVYLFDTLTNAVARVSGARARSP
jgi:hypothetical protein